MQLAHALAGLEEQVEAQLRVAGADAAEAGAQLLAALRPAIRQAMIEVVSMAATEVSSQLVGQGIEVRLVEGDPELVVTEDPSAAPPPPPHPEDDADEARITVRLPGYLKDLISDAAASSGDSVNSYVVDLLQGKAQARRPGTRHRTRIEL